VISSAQLSSLGTGHRAYEFLNRCALELAGGGNELHPARDVIAPLRVPSVLAFVAAGGEFSQVNSRGCFKSQSSSKSGSRRRISLHTMAAGNLIAGETQRRSRGIAPVMRNGGLSGNFYAACNSGAGIASLCSSGLRTGDFIVTANVFAHMFWGAIVTDEKFRMQLAVLRRHVFPADAAGDAA